jgi:hypothetical protein
MTSTQLALWAAGGSAVGITAVTYVLLTADVSQTVTCIVEGLMIFGVGFVGMKAR